MFVLISQVHVLLYIMESGMDRYISKFEKLLSVLCDMLTNEYFVCVV